MSELAKGLLIWWCVTGVVGAVMTMLDKHNARIGRRRIPERTLLLTALVGGAVVMLLTMRLIRHKTLHRRFMWGLPLMIVAQAAAVIGLWYGGLLTAVGQVL